MDIILMILGLLFFIKRYYPSKTLTASKFVVICFLGLLIMSFLYTIYTPIKIRSYNYFSMLHFFVCLVILFIPLVKHSGNYYRFHLNARFLWVASVIVVIGGFLNIFYNLSTHSLTEIMLDFGAARAAYYENTDGTGVQKNIVFWIAINMFPLAFFAMPLSLYNLMRQKKTMAFFLAISSISLIIHSLVEASRQEIFLWIGSSFMSFLMFWETISKRVKVYLSVVIGSIALYMIFFIMLITFSRFGEGRDAVNSVFEYFGSQPFHAVAFLETLQSQELWGQANFSSLIGEPYIYQLNEKLHAPFYLNVFGTIVGSFYLDFGYYTIIFCIIFALVFKKIMDFTYSKKSVLYFYVYIVYINLMFAGLFYNRFNPPGMLKPLMAFGIILVLYDFVARKNHNYQKSYSSSDLMD